MNIYLPAAFEEEYGLKSPVIYLNDNDKSNSYRLAWVRNGKGRSTGYGFFITSLSITDHTAVLIEGVESHPRLGLAAAEHLLSICGVHMAMYLVTREQHGIIDALRQRKWSSAMWFKNLNTGIRGTQIWAAFKRIDPVDNLSLFDYSNIRFDRDSWDPCVEHYRSFTRLNDNGQYVCISNTSSCCGAKVLSDYSCSKDDAFRLIEDLNDTDAPFIVALAHNDGEAEVLESANGTPIAFYEVGDSPRAVYGLLRQTVSSRYDYWYRHKECLSKAKVIA